MKYLEYDKGFYRYYSRRSCWSYHVTMGACPNVPERGRKIKFARDIDCEEEN